MDLGQRTGGSVELVTFTVGEHECALALGVVERALAMVAVTELPGAPAGVAGAINVHGELVPVLAPATRFGAPARPAEPGDRLLLARTSRRRVALAVDDVGGVLELPATAIVPADGVLDGAAAVAGVAVLADGLVVIHDLDAFLSADEEALLAGALAEITP